MNPHCLEFWFVRRVLLRIREEWAEQEYQALVRRLRGER